MFSIRKWGTLSLFSGIVLVLSQGFTALQSGGFGWEQLSVAGIAELGHYHWAEGIASFSISNFLNCVMHLPIFVLLIFMCMLFLFLTSEFIFQDN